MDLTQVAALKTNPVAALSFFPVLMVISLMAAGFLWFLQFCFTNTPGFTQYYRALQRIYNNPARPVWLREVMKPLGLCIYCQSAYFAAGVYLYLFGFELVNMLLFIGATYFFIELAARIIYPSPKNED
jgi:hypothetical protein